MSRVPSVEAPSFHQLLRQLGEAHDKEVADARSDDLPQYSPRASFARGVSSPDREGSTMPMGRQAAMTRDPGEVTDSDITKGQFSSADALAKLRSRASGSTRLEMEPLRMLTSHLHDVWTLDSEEINVAKGFTVPVPSAMATKDAKFGLFPSNGIAEEVKVPLWRLKDLLLLNLGPRALVAWDFMGILCIFCDMVWIPVQICFAVATTRGVQGIEWFVRLFWSLDLVIKVKQAAAFDTDQMRGLNAGRALWCCARSRWLFFDFAIVVVDWIPVMIDEEESSDSSVEFFGLLRIGKVPRIVRILRVLRLARMMKLEHFFFALRDNLLVSSESVSLILGVMKNMLCVLLLCHIWACMWYFVGLGDSDEHWVHFHGLDGPDTTLFTKYLWSFHWVAAQLTPATMQVLPRNETERLFNTILIVGGFMTFSTFMGAITASMTRLRNLSGNELSQFFLLRHYLYENRISRDLTVRVCRYAALAVDMHRKRINQDSVRHLKLLSGPLHVELQKEIYMPHLLKNRFFAGYYDWDASAMSQLCFVALGREFVAKSDILFSLGAVATRMYYTVAGTFIYQRRRGVKVRADADRPKRTARVGSGLWFCEVPLWVRWHHVGSMCALIDCELVQVDAEKFRDVTRSCEGVFSRSALYAKAFSRTMYDENGYVWDIPAEMIYPTPHHDAFACKHNWWQREVVDAEIAEAEWLAANGDSESEEEMDDRDTADDQSIRTEEIAESGMVEQESNWLGISDRVEEESVSASPTASTQLDSLRKEVGEGGRRSGKRQSRITSFHL